MKPIGDQVFSVSKGSEKSSHIVGISERRSAKDMGLPESWFRDAIFKMPELVIEPCRAAGLTNDDWYPWRKEFATEVGSIDVLLVSSQGRVAVVETKLASNPEGRRKVLAQALDYVTHLKDAIDGANPEIPLDENKESVTEIDAVREALSQGDVLVIIASDDIDSRVARLSRGLFSEHLVKHWDLALIDLAIYQQRENGSGDFLIVPCLRNVVESELRQVVRVIVQGEDPKATVEVEHVDVDEDQPARQKWDEKQFFEGLKLWNAPPSVQKLAADLRELGSRYPDSVSFFWGSGKKGTMVLKRNGAGLIEVRASGKLRFRPNKFPRALGDGASQSYREGLERLMPAAMKMSYPLVTADEAAKVAPAVFELIRESLELAERSR